MPTEVEWREIVSKLAPERHISWGWGEAQGGLCAHCYADIEMTGTHQEDCPWVRARKMLSGAE
jgi:hypothetical protein